ncbi:MAG: preprotein translocase subunit YajC [Eubacterium sp.]|nr:preprotein translocase subunit YajC [Eubacterium sp.]
MILLTNGAAPAGTGSFTLIGMVVYIIIMIVVFSFISKRSQKKQAAQQDELFKSLQPGDNIMTTSGFYGTILDVVDDTTIIVEFGNNKNCRIPMHKKAVAQVEKAGTAEINGEEE